MADDKLAPKPPSVKITGKPVASPLHQRLNDVAAAQKKFAAGDPLVVPNRIAIMADASGSMGGFKNRCLHDALTGFLNMCNFGDTSVAIYTFGKNPEIRHNLSRDKSMLMLTAMGIPASGGTPMSEAMGDALSGVSLTRGIIISDGCADSESHCLETASAYAEIETPIDCVHIGEDTSGEYLLKEIARITGGIYMKFTDSGAFAQAFSYLTPAKRGELTSSIAGLLGAKEIIK